MMPKAYSEDLRWRAVWLNIVQGMNYSEVAEALFMCEKSVYRYLSQFHATGSVKPKEHTGGPSRILTDFEQFTVLQCLMQRPTAFLDEIQLELFHITGKRVHSSTICRTIKQKGFTRKKVQARGGSRGGAWGAVAPPLWL